MKTLDFLNFSPRESFETYASVEFERVLAKAPSDSDGHLRAFFDQDRFVVEATITSKEGRFKSSVGVPIPSNHPKGRTWQNSAFDEMLEELERQIMKWNRHRFHSKPVDDDESGNQAA